MSAGSPLDAVRKPAYDRRDMWVVRELFRLLLRIAVAVTIASVIAEVRALVTGGDMAHTWKLMLLVLGGLMLLLGGTGTGSAASRMDWGEVTPGLGGVIFHGLRPRPEDPTLTVNAVFIGSGIAVLALGLFA
jgi:hypothetical protein